MNSERIINSLMCKYLITKEIVDTNKLQELLKQQISLVEFNIIIKGLVESNDGDFLGKVFFIGFLLDFFNENNIESLQKLLNLNFHKSHEDIVSLFQLKLNHNKETIISLSSALDTIPDYLSHEDLKYPYITKIMYAIGAHPEPFNILALKKIYNEVEDRNVRNLALEQIDLRKELGR